jgi:hypothetical protein
MILRVLLLSILWLAAVNAHSQTMSGNDLLQKLTEKNITGLHYLVGIVDAAYASRLVFAMNLMDTDEETRRKAEADLGKFWGCRPEKASYGQVVDVTVSYLKKHPNVRHLDSSVHIAAAMREAWPCN